MALLPDMTVQDDLAAALRQFGTGSYVDIHHAERMTLASAILDALPDRSNPKALRAALEDFVALLPPDRWTLLRPSTVALLAEPDHD